MGYQLGIDLGVSETTVAAVEAGWPAVVPIGGSTNVPTILHLAADGTARGGRIAARLARTDPDRHTARFVERLGEPAPILVGGVGYSASSLVARYLSWLVDSVTRLRAQSPELVVVTAPGSWPARRREGLAEALARVEADVAITARPAAAAALAVFVAGSVTLGLVLADDGDGDSAADTGPLPPSTIDQHPQFQADMMRSAEKAAGITAGDAAPATAAPDAPETVIATGSAEVAPITGTAYAMFREAQKGVTVQVSATDTDDGFARLCAGDADIAGASFALTDPACKDKVVGFEIAHHLLPIVVPKTNTWVKCLTTAQIGAMWKRDSTVTSWNQIDPSFPAEPLRLVGPAPSTVHAKVFLASMTGASDNTRKYREVELDEVPEEVEYDRGAIGFMNYYLEHQKDVTSRAHFVARDDATIRDNTAIVHAMTAGVEPVRT
ncbi:substrate-binding domain-containing protein [Parafrankia discariae]|uniref:substrate-binding domain-containing protein n=1 Tax=Parafrankia discariae TaxID=365528 RepID=UPI0003A5B5FD|nr:substrate-binding domain-containing protein [Parafrankia discariae]